MDLKAIKELVRLMRREGIVSIKTSEIELLVQPQATKTRKRRSKTEGPDALFSDKTFKGYTEEQILGWSATGEE